MLREKHTLLRLAVAAGLLAGACGGSETGEPAASGAATSDTATSEAAPIQAAPNEAAPNEAREDDERVVALAEEVILADLLALGITPLASSATVPEVGFQGLEGLDATDVEVLGMTTLNLEHLATLEPDVIVTYQFWVDQIGEDVLEGMAEVRVVPDGLVTEDKVAALGELFDREAEAEALIAELTAARAEAAAALGDDCEISAATIYGGPSIAAWVDGPWELPTSLLETGCTLVPGPEGTSPDGNGRAWLSLEQLGLLDAPTILLFQTDAVDTERDSVEEIMAESLWQQLPAVQADRVEEFDRLGYPGAAGQIRFLTDLTERLGG